jgi:hypothetical protein
MLILIFIVGLRYQRHPGIMPIGGTCSAVISAACHPSDEGHNVNTEAVQFGVIPLNATHTDGQSGSSETDQNNVTNSELGESEHSTVDETTMEETNIEGIEGVEGIVGIEGIEGAQRECAQDHAKDPDNPKDIKTTSETTEKKAPIVAGKCTFSSKDVALPATGHFYI